MLFISKCIGFYLWIKLAESFSLSLDRDTHSIIVYSMSIEYIEIYATTLQ